MSSLKHVLWRGIKLTIVFSLSLLFLTRSAAALIDQTDLIRANTRAIEFDFVSWTLDAIGIKLGQLAAGFSDYLSEEDRKQIVLDYVALVGEIGHTKWLLQGIYTDPDVTDPDTASQDLRNELARMKKRQALLGPLAETIVQEQISTVVAEIGLDLEGQTLPPILYHTSYPPNGLIISPRDRIVQIADISISPDLTLDEIVKLEEQVDENNDVSSLVVGIGGIGLYPTMVMETSDLNWLMEVVSHEWTHNYLTWHPLGVNYYTTPELRIINETTASIAGVEIGKAVIEKYYPELVPPPPAPQTEGTETENEPQTPPPFDFRAEMHATRVEVDRLLAEGKIEEAEAYMEARRRIFVENGYAIRKLNQAYFAFYGAYADQPGGAAGEDPVSAAVRQLRAQNSTLAGFLKRIAWVSSYEQLQALVDSP